MAYLSLELDSELYFLLHGLGLSHHEFCGVGLGCPHYCTLLDKHLSSNVENHSYIKNR